MKSHSGFTLIEILVTLSIIVVLGVVTFFNLQGGSDVAGLTSATQQVVALLRQAQSDSVAQEQEASWGVHFDNTNPNAAFYSLFYTTNSSYVSSDEIGSQYLLPSKVCYASSSVPTGSSTNIIFNPLSGAPSASATIILALTTGGCNLSTSTGAASGITRSASGKIFFDNFNRTNL